MDVVEIVVCGARWRGERRQAVMMRKHRRLLFGGRKVGGGRRLWVQPRGDYVVEMRGFKVVARTSGDGGLVETSGSFSLT